MTLIQDDTVTNVVQLHDDTEIITAEELSMRVGLKEDVSRCWAPPAGFVVGPDGGNIGDTWDGETYTPPPAPEPPPPTQEDYERAIQRHVDTVARVRNYRNGTALASYVSSTIPLWAAEAQAFVAWRDAVWVYAYAELEKVISGERAQPTIAEIILELPVIEWPEPEPEPEP